MTTTSEVAAVVARGKPHRTWLIRGLVVLATIVLAVFLWFWAQPDTQALADQYITQEVEERDLTLTVTATGTVEPTNLFEVSSELSGTVNSVMVRANDTVKHGQLLATLDTTKLDALVEHSAAVLASRQAQVAEANATLGEVQDAYDRNLTLHEQQLISREAFLSARASLERARAGLSSAEAQVRVARADMALDETNLSKAQISSPTDGVVLARDVEVGRIVASSLQAPVLFTLAEDLTQMELQVDVDEADIGQVAVGNPAVFTVEAWQGRSFPAAISEIRYLPETLSGVVSYKSILSVDNEALLLRPGMTATAIITVQDIEQALVVPNAALRFEPPVQTEQSSGERSGLLGMMFKSPPSAAAISSNVKLTNGKRSVYVLRDDTLQKLVVATGQSDGQFTVVTDGKLEAGDKLVTDLALTQ